MTSDQTDEKTEATEATEAQPEAQDGPEPAEGQGEGGVDQAEAAEAGPRRDGGADELQALRDRYLRLAAEFDNYRKRTERERSEARDRAQAQVVERLLEPLDDLQRVAQFGSESAEVASLLEGVRLVERKLLRVLESAGLEVIDAGGQPFDPELHEALMAGSTEDREEDDTVGQVFQTGYRFRGHMLRPARVQVRKFQG
jgi:molecular chaperone GrpE